MSKYLEQLAGKERRIECHLNDRAIRKGEPVTSHPEAARRPFNDCIHHPGVSGIHWERPRARRLP